MDAPSVIGTSNHPRTPASQALQRIVNLCRNKETPGRLTKAECISGYSAEEMAFALSLLEQSPAHPLLVIDTGNKPSRELIRLLRYPNVRTVNATQVVPDVAGAFARPRANLDNTPLYQQVRDQAHNSIRHDLRHALHDETKKQRVDELVLQARRDLLITGDDDTVIQRVLEQKLLETSEWWNMRGTFIDWENTLYRGEVIDRSVIGKARKTNASDPLVIWTGGDVERVYVTLSQAGIDDLHVCSKHDCNGIRVNIAIDDEPAEHLKKVYGLDAHQFIHVNDLLTQQ